MNNNTAASKVKVSGFADLFGSENLLKNSKDVRNVLISELHSFDNHPFKLKDDKRMKELVESIRENGVLVPGIARPRPKGGYEIISGHSRKHACEIAGITTMPMIIRNLDDDEAVIAMVDSNIQREDILPSEKALAFRLKYEAVKHQGKKDDSMADVEEILGENFKTVQRFIRLTYLIDGLMNMVDAKKLKFIPAVNISFLEPDEQKCVLSVIKKMDVSITTKQSKNLKELSQKGQLTEADVQKILESEGNKAERRKITISPERIDKYFSNDYSEEEIEQIILLLLEKWSKESEEIKNYGC